MKWCTSMKTIKVANPPCVICGSKSDGFYAIGGEYPEAACEKCAKPIQDRLNRMDYDYYKLDVEGHKK